MSDLNVCPTCKNPNENFIIESMNDMKTKYSNLEVNFANWTKHYYEHHQSYISEVQNIGTLLRSWRDIYKNDVLERWRCPCIFDFVDRMIKNTCDHMQRQAKCLENH